MNSRINELHNDVDKMKIESHNEGASHKIFNRDIFSTKESI